MATSPSLGHAMFHAYMASCITPSRGAAVLLHGHLLGRPNNTPAHPRAPRASYLRASFPACLHAPTCHLSLLILWQSPVSLTSGLCCQLSWPLSLCTMTETATLSPLLQLLWSPSSATVRDQPLCCHLLTSLPASSRVKAPQGWVIKALKLFVKRVGKKL